MTIKKEGKGNVLWRKGSFHRAFSNFFNFEAILINCVYCPKHSETKAGNGGFLFHFGCAAYTHSYCEYTHTDKGPWIYFLLRHVHTHKHKNKGYEKKNFERCDTELAWGSVAQLGLLFLNKWYTMCSSWSSVCVPPVPIAIKPLTHPFS